MSLNQKVNDSLKQAMKQGDSRQVTTLRLLMAALKNAEIEKGKELTEQEESQVVVKEAKKRQESIEAYKKGDRQDLVEVEEQELKLLEEYMPEQMSKEEIRQVIKNMPGLDQLKGNFGAMMGKAMAELKGKADGKLVGEVVRELV